MSQSLDLSRIPEPLRSKLEQQLSRLPAEARGKLEAQLARFPVENLEAMVASPLVQRLVEKSGKSSGNSSGNSSGGGKPANAARVAKAASGARAATARATESASRKAHFNDPNYHYNATIGRGDRPMPSLLVIGFVVALVLVVVRGCGGPG